MLQQQLLERQETRLPGFAAASVSESNLHLAKRSPTAWMLCMCVFNPRVDYHPHNMVPSFCRLFKIENILALFMPTIINSSFEQTIWFFLFIAASLILGLYF